MNDPENVVSLSFQERLDSARKRLHAYAADLEALRQPLAEVGYDAIRAAAYESALVQFLAACAEYADCFDTNEKR